jgi:sec-independent protein translocase protein TatB
VEGAPIVTPARSTADGELRVFDLSISKLLFLAVIALVIFGPNELPRIARQAGRALRDLRQIAEGAKADLREGLGPEFQDFDFEDLNPKRFVQKHLFEEPVPDLPAIPDILASPSASSGSASTSSSSTSSASTSAGTTAAVRDLALPGTDADEEAGAGDRPPFDLEAT